MCEDGYHLGEGPGKPRTKDHYGIYCGTPMGLREDQVNLEPRTTMGLLGDSAREHPGGQQRIHQKQIKLRKEVKTPPRESPSR